MKFNLRPIELVLQLDGDGKGTRNPASGHVARSDSNLLEQKRRTEHREHESIVLVHRPSCVKVERQAIAPGEQVDIPTVKDETVDAADCLDPVARVEAGVARLKLWEDIDRQSPPIDIALANSRGDWRPHDIDMIGYPPLDHVVSGIHPDETPRRGAARFEPPALERDNAAEASQHRSYRHIGFAVPIAPTAALWPSPIEDKNIAALTEFLDRRAHAARREIREYRRLRRDQNRA